jgi:hypothetical protein
MAKKNVKLAKRPINFKEESKRAVANKGKKGIPVLSERIAPGGKPLEDYLRSIDHRPELRKKSSANPIKRLKDAVVGRSKRNELMKKIKKNPQSEFSNPSRGRKII